MPKKMILKTKSIRSVEVEGVWTNVFLRILKSLQAVPTRKEYRSGEEDNHGGWVLPLAPGSGDPKEEGEGWLVLFPQCVGYSKTRNLISSCLGISLEDYDVVVVHDCR